jgi:hypothetical protein
MSIEPVEVVETVEVANVVEPVYAPVIVPELLVNNALLTLNGTSMNETASDVVADVMNDENEETTFKAKSFWPTFSKQVTSSLERIFDEMNMDLRNMTINGTFINN